MPFPKGVSGNPKGKPRGIYSSLLSEGVRKETHQGKDLVKFFMDVFRDEEQSIDRRIQAAEWLADRGFGKSVQSTDLNVEGKQIIVELLQSSEKEHNASSNGK